MDTDTMSSDPKISLASRADDKTMEVSEKSRNAKDCTEVELHSDDQELVSNGVDKTETVFIPIENLAYIDEETVSETEGHTSSSDTKKDSECITLTRTDTESQPKVIQQDSKTKLIQNVPLTPTNKDTHKHKHLSCTTMDIAKLLAGLLLIAMAMVAIVIGAVYYNQEDWRVPIVVQENFTQSYNETTS